MTNAHIKRIAELLKPDEIRMVGGYVRDQVLGIVSQDIDLATTALPENVMKKLEQGGVIVKPTGIDFGTVTAVMDRKPYEITTLREDKDCDGRHADVVYGTDWKQDAARRDFTMNAMSMGMDGAIHDYFGGQADAKAGLLKFVGEPAERIREDYLRILRLFRFYAYYGKVEPSAETLKACADNKKGIDGLSGERIQKEMMKLLAAPKPYAALELMQRCGVLEAVLPSADQAALGAVNRLQQIEEQYAPHLYDSGPRDLRRLALLLLQPVLDQLTQRWKLSRAQSRGLEQLLQLLSKHTEPTLPKLRHVARKEGKPVAASWLLNLAAKGVKFDVAQSLKALNAFEIPVFPLNGQHIMSQFPTLAGKKIGDYLATAEAAWEESEYKLGRDELLAILRQRRAQ